MCGEGEQGRVIHASKQRGQVTGGGGTGPEIGSTGGRRTPEMPAVALAVRLFWGEGRGAGGGGGGGGGLLVMVRLR